MYLEHWGLKLKPFENTPDPRFLYLSREHGEAIDKLMYAITEQKGAALLTGEYGCGKTLIIRVLIHKLAGSHFEIALMNFPVGTGVEFLSDVLYQFGVNSESRTLTELYRQIGELAYENLQAGKHNVLMVDEAQVIGDVSVFESLRMLLNLQFEDRFMITLILAGQPELREKIRSVPQLEQRISIRVHLNCFDYSDTISYIRRRLEIAGATSEIFSIDALRAIYKASDGVPRQINNICDLCLREGAILQAKIIDENVVKLVI